jgi:hypothetical protein
LVTSRRIGGVAVFEMNLPHAGSMPPIPPSQAQSNASAFPPWLLARLEALPADVIQQVQAQGLDPNWLYHLLEGLGEGAPSVPNEAWPNLLVWLRWIVPPRRFHMALAAVQAVGVHARRHGWGAVQRFFNDEDGEVARPPYAVFAWMLRRLLAGANAVDVATIDDARVVDHSQRALGQLFAGCDLAELHAYEVAWKACVITGGRSGELEPPPALIEWISLAGGEVMGHQLLKQEAFGSGHRAYLWPAVCSGQVIAFQLEPEQPFAGDIMLVYRPTLAGGWELADRPQGDMVWPQLQLAVIELGEALARMDLPHAVRQHYRDAAVRRARYSPVGSLYLHIDGATPAELAAVGQWFPKGEHPLERLRHVWETADSP